MNLGAQRSSHAIQQPVEDPRRRDDAFDGIIYSKGQGVLCRFGTYLGEAEFQRGVRAAAQKPPQVEQDQFQLHFLGRGQRQAFGQVAAHRLADHAFCTGAGAAGLGAAVVAHVAHQVFAGLRIGRPGFPGRARQ